jgi:uncharacterized protein YndB with AHSA1/START domain/limonene-1,2-epoxide hydrolase
VDTRAIHHEITFGAAPQEVFDALMNDKKHAAFTGASAQIDRKAGGKFTCYGGHLEGTTLELQENTRILQDWRAQGWPNGHYSRVTYTLTPLADGQNTLLIFDQTGVPADKFDEINKGWHTHYWLKMAAYLRDQKVAVVRRFMEEFKNKANLDIVDELFTSDFVLHLPGASLPPGPQSQKAVGKNIFDAFSGVHVTVNQTIVEGDRVVERHTARAKHTGAFNGIPATGRDVFWTENHIYRLRDGKIAETWSEISFHDLMAQISDNAAPSRKAS